MPHAHGIFKKTRIAPTPSGFVHLGNVFSFSLTAAIARQTGAEVFLRLDDLDQERVEDRYVQDIFDTLTFLGIPWNEGPRDINGFASHYSQKHRLPLYEKELKKLRMHGKIYACTCSRSQILSESPHGVYPGTCRHKKISLDTKSACWRLDTSELKELAVKNMDGSVIKTQLPPAMNDFIVRRKDGLPAYQLTSLMDDVHYGTDLIIRGEDLWPSTLAQLYLAQQLGLNSFHDTTFYHHTLIMNKDNEKLSKSAGNFSASDLSKNNSSAEIYRQITRLLNLPQPVGKWEDLSAWISLFVPRFQ